MLFISHPTKLLLKLLLFLIWSILFLKLVQPYYSFLKANIVMRLSEMLYGVFKLFCIVDKV